MALPRFHAKQGDLEHTEGAVHFGDRTRERHSIVQENDASAPCVADGGDGKRE